MHSLDGLETSKTRTNIRCYKWISKILSTKIKETLDYAVKFGTENKNIQNDI